MSRQQVSFFDSSLFRNFFAAFQTKNSSQFKYPDYQRNKRLEHPSVCDAPLSDVQGNFSSLELLFEDVWHNHGENI